MEEMKTNVELLKLLGDQGENQFLSGDWMLPMDDYDYNLEGVQSVPDLSATPFLSQPNYSTVTIGAAPGWMSENFPNSGNFKMTEESGAAQIGQGEIPEYSPAPSSTSSFFTSEEMPEPSQRATQGDETYSKIIASLGINEERLQKFTVKELNRFLKSNGLSKDQQQCVKNRRRTLKNRGYAQNCRIRRIKLKKSLEAENEDLFKELDQLRVELEKAKKERNFYKAKLVQFAKIYKQQKAKEA